MATRSTVCKFRLTLEERRALDADADLSLPRGVLPDLRCSADPASARLEVWPESHWPVFALRQADVFQSYAV